MSKKQEAAVVLTLALVGGVIAHKAAAKQAAVLGIPAMTLAVAGWLLSQALG